MCGLRGRGCVVPGFGWDVEGEMEEVEEDVSCCAFSAAARLVLVFVGEVMRSEVLRRWVLGRARGTSPRSVALGSWGEVGDGLDGSFRSDANGRKLGESSSSSSCWAFAACV